MEIELEGLYQLEGVAHALLARSDGMCLAAVPEDLPTEASLSATLAALQGTAHMAMRQVEGGVFSEALVRGERSEILCVSLGEDAVLGVVAGKGALTGLLFMAIEAAAQKILKFLQDASRES